MQERRGTLIFDITLFMRWSIRCKHLITSNMIADIDTKALAYGPLNELRDYILDHATLQEFFDDYHNVDTSILAIEDS